MRYILAFLFVVTGLAAGSLTIVGNWLYGFVVRESVAAAWIFFTIDVIKVAVPLLLIRKFKRTPIFATIGVIAFVGFSAFSVFAIRTMILAQTSTQQHTASTKSQANRDVRSELTSVIEQLKNDGWQRPAAQVEADLSAAKYDTKWTKSKECTEVSGDRRQYCADIKRLNGEKVAAERREKLQEREVALRKELNDKPAAKPVVSDLGDLATMFGIKPQDVTAYSTLVFAFLVELMSVSVPVLAFHSANELFADTPGEVTEQTAADQRSTAKPSKKTVATKPVTKPPVAAPSATPSAKVIPMRRQPPAVVDSAGTATPGVQQPGTPLGNPSVATPGSPQETLARAVVGTPLGNPSVATPLQVALATPSATHLGNPLAESAGNPLRSRIEAEADLLELLRSGNALPSQSRLAERWRVNSGTASKWVTKMEADGVIVVDVAEGGAKRISLPG